MKLVEVEVRYEGGTIITDRVVLNGKSGEVILPPRLRSLLEILDECDQRKSFIAQCAGVDFAVEGDREHGYLINFNVRSRRMHFLRLRSVQPPTAGQRKLNGRFAHMLSAWALIGACFEVGTARTWSGTSLLGPAVLCGLAVVLFILGHWCFATRDTSEQ